ncbi:BLUF domain-containing protein [Hymenobacter lapidarius]|nr:BLUF domain-containing protein [Hymenobacter lapidarius]
MFPSPLDTEAQCRVRDWAADLAAASTPHARHYEHQLLSRYQRQEVSCEQVLTLLDASPYHVLYRSHATRPFSEAQLQELLAAARSYNTRHHLTGLLLHSNGCFVQVLEGPKAVVQALYARIQQDARHTHVVTVSEGHGPKRRFGNWDMALGRVAGSAVVRAFETVLLQEEAPDAFASDRLLSALLQAFDVHQPPPTSLAPLRR